MHYFSVYLYAFVRLAVRTLASVASSASVRRVCLTTQPMPEDAPRQNVTTVRTFACLLFMVELSCRAVIIQQFRTLGAPLAKERSLGKHILEGLAHLVHLECRRMCTGHVSDAWFVPFGSFFVGVSPRRR